MAGEATSGEALVHVIDDDEDVRLSLEMLLDSAGLPVRSYAASSSFLDLASGLRAGCVLTDVRMPGMTGLELQRALIERGVRLPVIVMTGQADVPMAVQALKAGAVDFIEKPFDDEKLVGIVRAALAASVEASRHEAEAAGIRDRLDLLTPREREVLDGIVVGHPNKTIAYDLGTSPRTVEVQRARIMEKMQARSLPELVRMVLLARGTARPSA